MTLRVLKTIWGYPKTRVVMLSWPYCQKDHSISVSLEVRSLLWEETDISRAPNGSLNDKDSLWVI